MSYHGTNPNVRTLYPDIQAGNEYLNLQQTSPDAPPRVRPCVSACMPRVTNQLLTPIPPDYISSGNSKYFMTRN